MTLILQAHNLSFRYEGQLEPLFTNLDVHLYSGDRVALLGPNGAGKSTLLRVLLGQIVSDGTVTLAGRAAFVAQEDRLEHGGSVSGALLAHTPDLARRYREIRRLEAQGISDPLAYADAVAEFAARGGFDLIQACEVAVTALGFSADVLARPVMSLSGGERRLLKLASAFLQPADLLVLDEPTNYLDEAATAFLIERIGAFTGALLLVSHDRWFLDQTVSKIWELERRSLGVYRGNYTTFRATKTEAFKQKTRQKERLETEISKLQEVERTYKVWGARKEKEKSGAMDKGFIGARAARLQKRGILAKTRIQDRISSLKEARPWIDKHYEVAFRPTDVPSGTCLVVRGLTFNYGDVGLSDMAFTADWGERILLSGANGAGKSTLAKLMVGELAALGGELLWSKGVSLGYLPQVWQAPGVETAAELFRDDERQDARTLLGALRVGGDAFSQSLTVLSEGQKRKLSLVRLILNKPNVLILDEPTTHLDYESVEMLEAALSAFAGTVFLVSHDRYLREHVTDREITLSRDPVRVDD